MGRASLGPEDEKIDMRRLVFFLLWLSGLPWLLREIAQRRRVSILCYHDPRPDDFGRHITLLKQRYNIISLKKYLEYRKDPRAHLPRNSLVITLDDGYRGNYRLREVVLKHEVQVTLFVCSGIVGTRRRFWWEAHNDHGEMVRLTRVPDEERVRVLMKAGYREERQYERRQALSRGEIAALKDIIDVQSHTRFHPILPLCAKERVEVEIGGSRDELQSAFGLSIYALAFPNGDYSDREIAIARSSGYSCALTLNSGYNGPKTDLFALHRMHMSDGAGDYELFVKASGLWGFLEKLFPGRPYGYLPERIGGQETRPVGAG